MLSTFTVQWTIAAAAAPQPWLNCSGCKTTSPFRSSGKIRLNANGKRLDAWLIYHCTSCGKTWNRPLIERTHIRDIDPHTLAALEESDAEWVRVKAFDLQALRRHAARIDKGTTFVLTKKIVQASANWNKAEILLVVPVAVPVRLDRLLSQELPLSRGKLEQRYGDGTLQVMPHRKKVLRRDVADGMIITLTVHDDDRSMVASVLT